MWEYTGIPYADLIKAEALPSQPADRLRIDATEDYVFLLASNPKARRFGKDLRLKRFSNVHSA